MAFDIMSLLRPQNEQSDRINIIEDSKKRRQELEATGGQEVTVGVNVDQILLDALEDNTTPDLSTINTVVDASMASNVANIDKLTSIVGDITKLQTDQVSASTGKIAADTAIQQADLDAQFKLEQELSPVLQDIIDDRNELMTEADETTEDLLRDYEVAEKDANITFLDFLRPSTFLDALETKLISGPAAKRAIKVNSEKLAAIEAINNQNTQTSQDQINSFAQQAKLRSMNLRNLYGTQVEMSAKVAQANMQREFSVDTLNYMREVSGLNTNMMNAATAQLNTMAAMGDMKFRQVDNVMKYYQVQQAKMQLSSLKSMQDRDNTMRSQIQSQLDLIAPAVGLPEGATLDTYETLVKDGLITPEQQLLITNGIMRGQVSATAIFTNANPVDYYTSLQQVSPEMVTPEVKVLMNTINGLTDANGQTLADKLVGVSDAKDQNAIRNQHVKDIYATMNQDFSNVVRSNIVQLLNPKNIDYSEVPVSPALVDKLKGINANPSVWDGYVNTIAMSLAKDETIPLEEAAMSAGNLMAYQFTGINRVAGLGLSRMYSNELGGDATDANVWYQRLSAIRAGRERVRQGLIEARLLNY